MRRVSALLSLATLVLAPAAASNGLALTSPRFVVSGASQEPARAGVTLGYEQRSSDEAATKIAFFVPDGYRVTTGRRAGTPVGTAVAEFHLRDLNRVLESSGRIEVAAADLASRAESCTGVSFHDEIWAIRLDAAGERLVIPAYVNVAAARITICLEPGVKLHRAELRINSIANPSTAGLYRWRAVVTPSSEGAFELQSMIGVASNVTLRAETRRAKGGLERVTYRGALRSSLKGLGEAVVEVFRGPAPRTVRKFKTQAPTPAGAFRGSFTVERTPRAGTVVLLARASLAEQDLDATECRPTFEPIPCRGATVGAFSVTSKPVRVTIPAAPQNPS